MAKIQSLLVLNGVDYTGSVLTPFDIERNKLWGDDSGRVMSGDFVGTLIGIFPKLVVKILPKTEDELANLLAILDSPTQVVKYYSPRHKRLASLGTYTGDYKLSIVNLDPYYSEITISFIATKKE